jgi:hypothetical protein
LYRDKLSSRVSLALPNILLINTLFSLFFIRDILRMSADDSINVLRGAF